MSPIVTLWLATTFLLGSLQLISEWLTGTGISIQFGSFTLAVFAFGCLLLFMRRWWQKTVRSRVEPLSRALTGIKTGTHSAEPLPSGSDQISKLAGLVYRFCSELNPRREAMRDSGRRTGAISPCRQLSGNLALAADHVDSIRALLEISQTRQQPIPRAAFQNLKLVSKHLREIQRQLDTGPQAA